MRQRLDEFVDRRLQDLARPQVRDVRRTALAETDDGAVLLRHPARREPRAPAVVPDVRLQRRQRSLRRDQADARQRFEQLLLLELELPGRGEMLQGAAAADAKMCATRR